MGWDGIGLGEGEVDGGWWMKVGYWEGGRDRCLRS